MDTFIYSRWFTLSVVTSMNQYDSETVCPNCASEEIVFDYIRGEKICRNCGVVMSKIIDKSPEWRAFTKQEKSNRSRVGSPISALKSDFGLSSQICFARKDSYGRNLSPSTISKMRRLRWLNRSTTRSHIRNLRIALRQLKRMISQLEISDEVAETAATIYRKALKTDLIRGRSIESMVAAAVYIAARQHHIPQTLKDVELTVGVNRKIIARCFRLYVQELNIKPARINPKVLLSKLCDKLKLTTNTQNEAMKILEEACDQKLNVGKNPMSIAAAAIYIAGIRTGERRTQQQVAKAAKTTPVTLRNRFREIVDNLDLANVVVKRGAASAPVYVRDPWKF